MPCRTAISSMPTAASISPPAVRPASADAGDEPAGDRRRDPDRDRQHRELQPDQRGAVMVRRQVVRDDEQRPEQRQVGHEPAAETGREPVAPQDRQIDQGREHPPLAPDETDRGDDAAGQAREQHGHWRSPRGRRARDTRAVPSPRARGAPRRGRRPRRVRGGIGSAAAGTTRARDRSLPPGGSRGR